MFISLLVINRSHVQASAAYFEFEEEEEKSSPFDVKESGPQIHHFTHDHGVAGSVLAKSVTFRAPDANGDEEYVEKRLRRLVSFDFDLMFPPYDDVFEHLIVSIENGGMESSDVKDEDDENQLRKIYGHSPLSEVKRPESTYSGTGAKDDTLVGGKQESETSPIVSEHENAASIKKGTEGSFGIGSNDQFEPPVTSKNTNIDATDESIEKTAVEGEINEEIDIASVHLEESVLDGPDDNIDENFYRSDEEVILVENETPVDVVDESVQQGMNAMDDSNADTTGIKDSDVNKVDEDTNEGINADQAGDNEVHIGKTSDENSISETGDGEEYVEDIKENDKSAQFGDSDIQVGGSIDHNNSTLVEGSEAKITEAESYKISEGLEVDNEQEQNIPDDSPKEDDFANEDDEKQTEEDRNESLGQNELDPSVQSESSDNSGIEKNDQKQREEDRTESLGEIELELFVQSESSGNPGIEKNDQTQTEESVEESELELSIQSESSVDAGIENNDDNLGAVNEAQGVASKNLHSAEEEIFVEDEEGELFDIEGEKGDGGSYQKDEYIEARKAEGGITGEGTITQVDADVGVNAVKEVNLVDGNTEGIQSYDIMESEESNEETYVSAQSVADPVSEQTQLHENEYHVGSVENNSNDSFLEETEDSHHESLEEEELPPIKQTSVNDEFVSGLDDLDKFMEEVDPPDELDVGAGGLSIQEIILGQGAQIIKTRVRKGLHQLKQMQRQTKDRFDDTKKVLDEKVESALIAIKETKSEGGNLRKAVILVVHKIIHHVKELMDDLGINVGGDSGNDEDQYSPIVIDDDEIAEMRRKLMERKAVQQEQLTARQSFQNAAKEQFKAVDVSP